MSSASPSNAPLENRTMDEAMFQNMKINDECRNFGSRPSDYAMLENKIPICVTFTKNSMQDNFSQMMQIMKGNMIAKACLDILGFLNMVCAGQNNIDATPNGTPRVVVVLEQFQPPENPEKPFSSKNIPACMGVRWWYFFGDLRKFEENKEPHLYVWLNRYIRLMDRFVSQKYPQSGSSPPYRNLTSNEMWLEILQQRSPDTKYTSLINTVSTKGFMVDTCADPIIALRMQKSMMNYNETIDYRQCVFDQYFTENPDAMGTVRLMSPNGQEALHQGKFAFPYPNRAIRFINHNMEFSLINRLPMMVEAEEFNAEINQEASLRADLNEMESRGFVYRNKESGEVRWVSRSENMGILERDLVESHYTSEELELSNKCDSVLKTIQKMAKMTHRKVGLDEYDPNKIRDESDMRRQMIIRHSMSFFNSQVNLCASKTAKKDLQSLIAANLNQFYDICVREFVQRWDVNHPDISPYVIPVIKYSEKFKETNNNSFFKRFRKLSKNLSLIEDCCAFIAKKLGKEMRCGTCHDRAFANVISAMSASDPDRKAKLSTLTSGLNSTSKSYSLDVARKLMISETTVTFTFKSVKADTPGGNHDSFVQQMNEAGHQYLGVNESFGGGKNQQSSDEQASMFKDILTEGMNNIRSLVIDKNTGKRQQVETKSYRNGLYQLCTNLLISKCDPATITRFLHMEATEIPRAGYEIIDLLGHIDTQQEQEERQEFVTFMCWLQMHTFIVNFMLNLGYLMPINTNFHHQLLVNIVKLATKYGVIEAQHPRKFQRVLIVDRVFIVWRAVLLYFASNINFRNYNENTEHSFRHHINLQGHLNDNDPTTLTMALTTTKDFDYENIHLSRSIRSIEMVLVHGPIENPRKSNGPNVNKRKANSEFDTVSKVSKTGSRPSKLEVLEDEDSMKSIGVNFPTRVNMSDINRSVALMRGEVTDDDLMEIKVPDPVALKSRDAETEQSDWDMDCDVFYKKYPQRRERLESMINPTENPNFISIRLPFLENQPDGGFSESQCIGMLADKIMYALPIKPSKRRIIELLYKLKDSPPIRDPENKEDVIKNQMDYDPNSEKPIQFSKDRLLVHKNLFFYNRKNRMDEAVREVLEPIIDKNQDILFGWKRGEHYEEFNVLHLKKRQIRNAIGQIQKSSVISNKFFQMETSKEFDLAIYDPFQAKAALTLMESKLDESEDIQKVPFLILDHSLANVFFLNHLANIRWSSDMIIANKVFPQSQLNEELLVAHEEERLEIDKLCQFNPDISPLGPLKDYPEALGLLSSKHMETIKDKEIQLQQFYSKYSMSTKLKNCLAPFRGEESDPNNLYFNPDHMRDGVLNAGQIDLLKSSIRSMYVEKMEKLKQKQEARSSNGMGGGINMAFAAPIKVQPSKKSENSFSSSSSSSPSGGSSMSMSSKSFSMASMKGSRSGGPPSSSPSSHEDHIMQDESKPPGVDDSPWAD